MGLPMARLHLSLALLPLLALGCVESSIQLFEEDASSGVPDGSGPRDAETDADAIVCTGPVPICHQGRNGDNDCCFAGGTPATCAGGEWICPPSTFAAGDCDRIASMCEEGDGGVDGGAPTGLYDFCGDNGDCVLTPSSCCGACGTPTATDVVAVNVEAADDYSTEVACREPAADPCEECPSADNPHLAAWCGGDGIRPACTVVDFAAEDFVRCEEERDCQVLSPTCCQPCTAPSPTDLVAVRVDVDLRRYVCSAEEASVPCVECAPVYPAVATCEAGRCVLGRP